MMNEMKIGAYSYNGESCNFEFRTDISAHNKAIFVRTVVDTIVDDTGYDSVLRDIIFDYVTVSMFTNIDTSFLNTVDAQGNTITDIDLLENFLLSTNIVEIVKENAFPTLFGELNDAVDKSIAYRTGIHPSPLSDAIASLLSTIEKKIDGIDLESMTKMAEKFAGMKDELSMKNLVKEYMDSDVHKQNFAEIMKAKTEKNKAD